MVPRQPTREQVIDWLGEAAEQAELAEIYHAAAANPAALDGGLARQAVRDAVAMQLIELVGTAEDFTRERGEPGTTLARLDDALRALFKARHAHVHPELRDAPPPPVTPAYFHGLMGNLKAAIVNLDRETLNVEPANELKALGAMYDGLIRVEKDGLPDPAALRPRDLHYAGYYHEIQFGRLAKATGLYDNRNGEDPRIVDVNRSIFDADDMAHKFLAMRASADKSRLPVSVVSPEHRDRVPGRSLSELMRELRQEYQRPEERLEELAKASAVRTREEYRDSVRGLAQQYVRMAGDTEAASSIYAYVQRQKPPLDRTMIDGMRQVLQAAADPGGDYLGAPELVRNRCIDLCLELDRQGDGRLLDILDAADRRARARENEAEALIRGLSSDTPVSKEAIDRDPWAAVYQPIPADADTALLRKAHDAAMHCAAAVVGAAGPAANVFEPTLFGKGEPRAENFERAVRRIDELGERLRAAQPPGEPQMVETPKRAGALHEEPTAEGRAGDKEKLARDILDQQADIHSHYEIAAWQGGFGLLRIYEIDDETLQQYGMPAGQQLLGRAETLDQLHETIIDGSALTAYPQWVTDEQLGAGQNQQPLTLDDIAVRVQRILDDPTCEADELEESVLQALQERRAGDVAAEQATAAAAEDELLRPTAGDDDRHALASGDEPASESSDGRTRSEEQTDDEQDIEYDRWTGQPISDAGHEITGSHSFGGGGRGGISR
jgi:hypothetical protein